VFNCNIATSFVAITICRLSRYENNDLYITVSKNCRSVSEGPDQGFLKEFLELRNSSLPFPSLFFPSPILPIPTFSLPHLIPPHPFSPSFPSSTLSLPHRFSYFTLPSPFLPDTIPLLFPFALPLPGSHHLVELEGLGSAVRSPSGSRRSSPSATKRLVVLLQVIAILKSFYRAMHAVQRAVLLS